MLKRYKHSRTICKM